MIHYSVQEWGGQFFVIALDETDAEPKAEIVHSCDTYQGGFDWIRMNWTTRYENEAAS